VSKVDLVLELLGDGKWHEVEEVQRNLKLDGLEVQEILEFLSKYELAEVDSEKGKVRLNRDFQKLLGLNAV
jgi:DNA-binding IclR family transcriptional regulator